MSRFSFTNFNFFFHRPKDLGDTIWCDLDVQLYESLKNGHNLTSLSNTETALNDILAKSQQELPWRLRGDYENILPRRSSIKLPFLKSAKQIEELRLEEERGVTQDEGEDEGNDEGDDENEDDEDTDSIPLPEEGEVGRDEDECEEDGDGRIDFTQDENENSFFIFPRSMRKSHGLSEDRNITENAPKENEADDHSSAFARFSKESSQQQSNELGNDVIFQDDQNDNRLQGANNEANKAINTPLKFANLEQERCSERLAKIRDTRSKKNDGIMHFQVVRSVIDGK